MCMCMYCYRRHMGNHVYQIQYKICMFAEIQTSVKFIRILFLGKAPDPTINNTIPCSLSLLCYRYTILSISVSLKLISSLTETQASSPTFHQKDIWYKRPKRKKVPVSFETFSFKKCVPWLVRKTTISAPWREHDSRADSKESPCRESAAVLKPGVWQHTSANLTTSGQKERSFQPHHSAQNQLLPGYLAVSWTDRWTTRKHWGGGGGSPL